jgi:hypothetical protein
MLRYAEILKHAQATVALVGIATFVAGETSQSCTSKPVCLRILDLENASPEPFLPLVARLMAVAQRESQARFLTVWFGFLHTWTDYESRSNTGIEDQSYSEVLCKSLLCILIEY